jgi:hypothetical protein
MRQPDRLSLFKPERTAKGKLVEPKILARHGRASMVVSVTAVVVLAFNLLAQVTAVRAEAVFAPSLCGNGSAPDYGFTYPLQQPHWTLGWQGHASEQTVTEVDAVLDQLNADSIAQTMILIQPQEQVGNRVNCAVHFLRYMQLGLPDGERKDNGFVFLIVIDPKRIDVHYGVGLGLPALTAPELTAINRDTEDAYQVNQSMDQALLTLVQEFYTVARTKYEPLASPSTAPESIPLPQLPSGPLGILTICGLICLGLLILPILLWLLPKLLRSGIGFNPYGSGSRGSGGFPLGGGRSGPSMRGGSGSGRSGRGN